MTDTARIIAAINRDIAANPPAPWHTRAPSSDTLTPGRVWVWLPAASCYRSFLTGGSREPGMWVIDRQEPSRATLPTYAVKLARGVYTLNMEGAK